MTATVPNRTDYLRSRHVTLNLRKTDDEGRSKDDVRRDVARSYSRAPVGRGGLPQTVVQTMHDDYVQLGSLAKVAKIYGRTRQAQYDLFVSHGFELRKINFHEKVSHAGKNYTPGKNGYLRCTTGDREPLHHVLWSEKFGPVPDGHQVTFKDGDSRNFEITNLACLPVREVTLFHHRRHLEQAA